MSWSTTCSPLLPLIKHNPTPPDPMVREAAHSTKESAASSLNAGRGEGGEVVVVVEETFEELSSRDEAIASCCAEGGMPIDEDVTLFGVRGVAWDCASDGCSASRRTKRISMRISAKSISC